MTIFAADLGDDDANPLERTPAKMLELNDLVYINSRLQGRISFDAVNLQNITLDKRESPHRKRTQPLDLHWHGEKPEMPGREPGEVRQLLDNGNFVP